jgi:ribosomal protein S18 acetylase RimI-like enzyme
MEIRTLQGTDEAEILSAFNSAFSNYFTPLQLSEEQLSAKLNADRVQLDLSVGAFDNGQLVAFILHGLANMDGKQVAYNGGTGVVPAYRGKGLTQQLYHYIQPRLKKAGVDYVMLEAITKNVQAIKAYERAGFEKVRCFKCYKGELTGRSGDSTVVIQQMPYYDWLQMEAFWDRTPSWQYRSVILNALKQRNVCLGAYAGNTVIGYLIHDPSSNRLQQLAVAKTKRRKGIGSALMAAVTQKYGNKLAVINVDAEDEATNMFMEKIGLPCYLEQVEMKWVVS